MAVSNPSMEWEMDYMLLAPGIVEAVIVVCIAVLVGFGAYLALK